MSDMSSHDQNNKLRTGWTTGACAAAAAKAAFEGLMTGTVPEKVSICLPKGQNPIFQIERSDSITNTEGHIHAVQVGIIKDAGDDPDVTHQAMILAKVSRLPKDNGLVFRAGEGVGTITKKGLPLPVGEPAINPMPRKIIEEALTDIANVHGESLDMEVEISIPNGEELAKQTWNPRLGILGGLSILGTTGIVRPYSCAAWIASIHRGIDVAQAEGLHHVIGSTGATSEKTAATVYDLPPSAFLDMGDFVGGMLKYLRRHPIEKLTIIGGIGKMTKLAQGAMDLHSGRSQVNFIKLGQLAQNWGKESQQIEEANTALEAYDIIGPEMAVWVAQTSRHIALETINNGAGDTPNINVETIVINRQGDILARASQEQYDPD